MFRAGRRRVRLSLSAGARNIEGTGARAMMLAWIRHRIPDRIALSTSVT
jgi:hypothetical protein